MFHCMPSGNLRFHNTIYFFRAINLLPFEGKKKNLRTYQSFFTYCPQRTKCAFGGKNKKRKETKRNINTKCDKFTFK